jgi:ribosomal protein S18 acetylase RimI-like enzyme
MSAPAIRLAVESDAPAIASVQIETWRKAYVGLITQDYLDGMNEQEFADRWARNIATQGIAARRNWVAELNGAVVGFLACGPSRDEDADKGIVGEIYAVYVRPQAWGTGAGRALMQAGIEHLRAQGFREAMLWVLTGNERTRRFYEIAGMKPDGGTKTDTRGGMNAHETRYRMVL